MTPTPEQVAQWAREAGFHAWYSDPDRDYHFACATKLVTRAMAEQAESDAKLCDSLEYEFKSGAECAAAIRANAPNVTT